MCRRLRERALPDAHVRKVIGLCRALLMPRKAGLSTGKERVTAA
jgi:hypothetical protein